MSFINCNEYHLSSNDMSFTSTRKRNRRKNYNSLIMIEHSIAVLAVESGILDSMVDLYDGKEFKGITAFSTSLFHFILATQICDICSSSNI